MVSGSTASVTTPPFLFIDSTLMNEINTNLNAIDCAMPPNIALVYSEVETIRTRIQQEELRLDSPTAPPPPPPSGSLQLVVVPYRRDARSRAINSDLYISSTPLIKHNFLMNLNKLFNLNYDSSNTLASSSSLIYTARPRYSALLYHTTSARMLSSYLSQYICIPVKEASPELGGISRVHCIYIYYIISELLRRCNLVSRILTSPVCRDITDTDESRKKVIADRQLAVAKVNPRPRRPAPPLTLFVQSKESHRSEDTRVSPKAEPLAANADSGVLGQSGRGEIRRYRRSVQTSQSA